MIAARFQGRLGAFELNAELTTPASGITAIMGPSGCGKTSFLRCIAGLAHLPGALTVSGEVWQDERRFLPAHRRTVGYVFQEASLLPHVSVRRNLRFGLERARREIRIGEAEVVSLLGIEPLLDRSPNKLSGGERQRVAIGRALLRQPALLLMDEPLSSLDAEGKAEILPCIARLPRALAIPVIYVSHDPVEVMRLADRTWRMSQGRILEATPTPTSADELLATLGPDQLRRLALSALKAGLPPSD